MKRILSRFGLLVFYVVLMVAVVLPFAGELKFEQARRLEKQYMWEKAGKEYRKAELLCPFNGKYPAELGAFLMDQAKYHKDNVTWLQRSSKCFKRACVLNPVYARYRHSLGEANLKSDNVDAAVRNFKRAVELDPYNFQLNYSVGHNLLVVWESLGAEQKDFVAERLAYVFRIEPEYVVYFYPEIVASPDSFTIADKILPETLDAYERLYYYIRNNGLWELWKQAKVHLDFYRRKEEPEKFRQEELARMQVIRKLEESTTPSAVVRKEDWLGRSEQGGVYENGNMYWDGTVNALIDLPPGDSVVYIQAKGTPANGVFPYMVVELAGEVIGERLVEGATWQEYAFPVNANGGVKVLSVQYVNDGTGREKQEDRNLYLGEARVEKNEQ